MTVDRPADLWTVEHDHRDRWFPGRGLPAQGGDDLHDVLSLAQSGVLDRASAAWAAEGRRDRRRLERAMTAAGDLPAPPPLAMLTRAEAARPTHLETTR